MMGLQKMPQKHWRPRPCDIGGASKWSPGMMDFPGPKWWAIFGTPESSKNHRVDLLPPKPKPKNRSSNHPFLRGKRSGGKRGKNGGTVCEAKCWNGHSLLWPSTGKHHQGCQSGHRNSVLTCDFEMICYENLAIMAGQPTNPLLT